MKFNVYFRVKGAARTVDAPNRDNPVECANLASLLSILANNLPQSTDLMSIVGIRIEESESEVPTA